jgi:hypothetical protein
MNSSDGFSVLVRIGTQIENGIQVWVTIPSNPAAENLSPIKNRARR